MKRCQSSAEIVIHEDGDLRQILSGIEDGDIIQATLKCDFNGRIAATTILRLVRTGHLEFEQEDVEAGNRLQAFVDRGFPEGHQCLYTEVKVVFEVSRVADNLFPLWEGIHRIRTLRPVNEKAHLLKALAS